VLDAEDVLNGLIRGALSGRRKPWRHTHQAFLGGSLINARTMLAAAGVAWGLYESWQQQQQGHSGAAAAVPPPLPGQAAAAPPRTESDAGLPPALLQLLRLMISAARADGEIGPAERERIVAEAREVGAEADVARELETPRPVAEIVAGVNDPELRQQLYALGYTIVRADDEVTGAERIYLAQLANRLGLDAQAVTRLENEVSARIEAARRRAAPDGAPAS
jgi:uncharacterized membrane protein YebE (DUF533 family)